MLHVGLTGGLGSGKSTAARMFASLGAKVLSSDEIGRAMMRPGERVFAAIVQCFGPQVVGPGGDLDRRVLARLAFVEGRLPELNAIVHPAVIEREAELAREMARKEPAGVLLVESALLFETEHGGPGGWRSRFDRVVLVTATEAVRVDRYVRRTVGDGERDEVARAAEARRRIAQQTSDEEKRQWADFVIENDGSMEALEAQVTRVWRELLETARDGPTSD